MNAGLKRVDKVDTLQVEISFRELSLDIKVSRTPKGVFVRTALTSSESAFLARFAFAKYRRAAIPPLPKSVAFGVPL